jgi:pimeloyl-ACP methyl ester carboxylesterase
VAHIRQRPATDPRTRTVDIGGPVTFEEWDGPHERTFVLVHGLGGSHLNWRLVAPELSSRGRVLVPDLVGFGRTPRAGRSSAILPARRLLSRFLSAHASGEVILAGNSMGGALAVLQAAFEPDSVAGIVPTASVLPWARGGVPAPIVAGGFALYRIPVVGERLVRGRFQHLGAERSVRLGFRLTAHDVSVIPVDLVEQHVDLLRTREHDPEAAAAFLEGARSILRLLRIRGRYRDALDAVRCPVLLIHGSRDRFVPAAFARAAAIRHPGWRLIVLPEVGHIPQLEAPHRWTSAVHEWLDDLAGR